MQIDTTSYRSPNYDYRPARIEGITLHTGEGTRQSDLSWLCSPRSGVSCHYYVCRDSTIYQLVDDERRAWHAGQRWGNDCTIGIETEHRQGQDWPTMQRTALAALCRHLIAQYGIEQGQIVAHRWLTPGRKIDPTDWPDSELHTWIADLYGPLPPREPALQPGWYCCAYPATVRTAPDRQRGAIVATFAPESHVYIGTWVTGQRVGTSSQWGHLSQSQLGFIHASALATLA